MSTQATSPQDNPLAGFGPNEWIVEDMYQRYLADPGSVDPAWHEFFADYKPAGDTETGRAGDGRAAEGHQGQPTAAAKASRSRRVKAGRADEQAKPPRKPADRAAKPAQQPSQRTGQAGQAPTRQRPPPRARREAGQAPSRRAAPKPAVRRTDERQNVPLRGVAARIAQNMDDLAPGADGDQRPRGAGEAARRQPHRDQQPPRPRPRRQGQLHPPHRLRDGEGAAPPTRR